MPTWQMSSAIKADKVSRADSTVAGLRKLTMTYAPMPSGEPFSVRTNDLIDDIGPFCTNHFCCATSNIGNSVRPEKRNPKSVGSTLNCCTFVGERRASHQQSAITPTTINPAAANLMCFGNGFMLK